MGWVGSGHTVWTHGQLCSLYSGTHYWCIRVRSATEQRSVLEFASATTRPHFPPGTVCPLYLRQFILFPSVVLRGSIFDVLLTPARLAGGRPTLRLSAYTPAVLIMSLSVAYVPCLPSRALVFVGSQAWLVRAMVCIAICGYSS